MKENDESTIAAAGEIRKGLRLWTAKQVTAIALFAVLQFSAAGRLDWIGGWALIGILFLYFLVTLAFFVPHNPGLYAERSALKKGTKSWDIALTLLVSYTPLFLGLIAGLDLRFAWANPIPAAGRIALGVLTLPGLALLSWAMMSNNFFSATVRIQFDRGHAVASSGPYRVIRHPGYVGGFLFYAGLTGTLGSMWGFLSLGVSLVLLIMRTALEDGTLRRELPGYADYCARTRYRLLPGIW